MKKFILPAIAAMAVYLLTTRSGREKAREFTAWFQRLTGSQTGEAAGQAAGLVGEKAMNTAEKVQGAASGVASKLSDQ